MKLIPIKQQLTSNPIAKVRDAVRLQLESLGRKPPKGEIAITAGSRGIANIALILRSCGEWLREQGAEPFVVPAMGSHNGATAAGQQAMLEGLGMTELALDMPIRSSMDTVAIAKVPVGIQQYGVFMDRQAYGAAGVLAVNRIKLHTSFGGPPYGSQLESGVAKMLAVGLGKIDAARAFHKSPTSNKPAVLGTMTEALIATGKVWAGLAILEDGLDQTAELHALAADEIVSREPQLLAQYAESYFPRLPIDNINVLVVDEIGKNYSGTGMDTNVIGRRGLSDAPDPPTPSVKAVAALRLSPESQGNAVGVGLADVVTQGLVDAMDPGKTRLNAETAGEPSKAIPKLVLPNEEAVYDWLRRKHGDQRWVRIPNTLKLDEVEISEDLVSELPDHCSVS